ncbi:MAG: DUF4352 domain-containing protein [Haloarculaceae archaeon]
MPQRTRRALLKLAPVVALPLAGCSGTDDAGDPSPSDGPADEASAAQSPTDTSTSSPDTADGSASVSVGQVVAGEKLRLVVRSVSTTRQLGEYQRADAGQTYEVVRIAVKNVTRSATVDFNSVLQLELRDGSGDTYTPTLSLSDAAFENGQLAPGEVARGDVAFEIPQDARDLRLHADFSAFSDGDGATVDLGARAADPADLEQSLQVPVHDVGETVSHEGIAVTANGASFEDALGEYTQAPAGKEYAIVDVTTANRTDHTEAFSSLLQMGVKDGAGWGYDPSALASGQLSNGYDGGDVAPGGQSRGAIAFEVRADAAPLYFAFEYAVLTGGSKTFWRLR